MQNPHNRRVCCVNCNICVNTIPRHLVFELDTRVITVICEWISPIIVTEEDYICDACLLLSLQTVNAGIGNEPSSSSSRGHIYVCVVCGRSLLNRQKDSIVRENPSELQRAIQTEVENRIAPRQVTSSTYVCHPCWLSVKRSVLRTQENYDNHTEPPTPSSSNQEVPVAIPLQDTYQDHQPEPSMPSSSNQDIAATVTLPDTEQDRHHDLPIPASSNQDLPGTLTLPNYKRAANTASHCLFHHCLNRDLHRIGDKLRASTLVNHKYYIPKYAVICSEHLQSNNWEMLFDSGNSLSTLTAEQIEHVFTFVNVSKIFLDFSNMQSVENIEDHLFVYWLGMSKEQFMTLVNEVPRIMEKKRGLLGLGALLMKMRNGDSDDRLSQLLQLSRRTVERSMDIARGILLSDFVPRNLGINHISRERLLERNLMIPNAIFNEHNTNAIVICDGTYIYLNKSSNYMFQKDSYSLHKYRNLLKPFMIVTCDGYIVDCLGPYKATTSDSDIMKSLFRDDSPLRQYFQENDIFILDRGFRDSVSFLEACSYKPYLPETRLEGEYQLTTQQANRSRCVTICRWVVEVVNGYFKRDYKLFRQDFFNKSVPHLMDNFKIAASLLNRFGVRLQNRSDAVQIIDVMRQRFQYHNSLSDMINILNMNRRTSSFLDMTAENNIIAFPHLQYSELILFALGTYQIRQARSYYGEHVRSQGRYRIEVCRESINISEYRLRGSGDNTLIRAKIVSRHVSRKTYYVYILIENSISGREAIPEYCCNCIVGRRTIGCCAHVMTVVWYLGWARHQERIITAPAGFLDSIVIRDDEEL